MEPYETKIGSALVYGQFDQIESRNYSTDYSDNPLTRFEISHLNVLFYTICFIFYYYKNKIFRLLRQHLNPKISKI